jgi:hypothetical protein
MTYIDWLKARIEHAIETGEHWMIDGLAIARAWAEHEAETTTK